MQCLFVRTPEITLVTSKDKIKFFFTSVALFYFTAYLYMDEYIITD